MNARALAIALALGVFSTGCSSADEGAKEPDFSPAGDDAGADAITDGAVSEDTHVALDGTPEPADSGTTEDAVTSDGGLAVGCAFKATTDVNLREGPSTTSAVLHVIPDGDLATLLDVTPKDGFYQVKHGGESGWAFGAYFDKSCGSSDAGSDASVGTGTVADIEAIAVASSCYAYDWKDRGNAPKGYMKGVADTFARAVCNPTRSDVLLVSKPKTSDDVHDALSWYASNFAALGMANDVAGVVTMRHVYTLMIGLGMRESSGRHCCGRDTSATNTSSSAAEAGAWQTSYDSHSYSTELSKLFSLYRTTPPACHLDAFEQGVTCNAANWEDWGTGADGLAFQKIEKECPTFAAEYAAMMLRLSGGSVGHYGPLRTKAAELRTECDQMLQKVQTYVETHPSVCAAL